MPHVTSRRRFFGLLALGSTALLSAPRRALALARPGRPRRRKKKDEEAWLDGKGMCVFPFAAERLPETAGGFATAMEQGYRRSLRLPRDAPVVETSGGTYPVVDAIRIDFSGAVVDSKKEGRKPSDRYLTHHALDAGRLEVLGQQMTVEDVRLSIGMTASDARLLMARDKRGKPLLVLGDAKDGRMTFEMTVAGAERLLHIAVAKGGRAYGLSVDDARLKLTVEDGRTVRVDLKLFTRLGVAPAGLRFRARLDIDERLDGTLSQLSCSGDEILGPLISGLIAPFLKQYNGKTRPLMNFPATEMRLHDIRITADQTIRVTADFGS